MQHDSFSRNIYKVIDAATAVARRLGCRYIGSEHILYGLLSVEDGRASSLLREAGLIEGRYYELLKRAVDPSVVIPGNMFTARTKRLLDDAKNISVRAKAGFVGTEHLLLALLIMTDCLAVTLMTM